MFFHLYGFFIALGILVGAWISENFRKRLTTYNLQLTTFDILPWVLIPGIIGSRLYHVLDYWEYYSQSPLEIFMVWQGGLGIFGGIIGGGFGLFAFSYYSALRSTRQKFFSSNRARTRADRQLSLRRDAFLAKKENFCWSPRALIKIALKKFFVLLDLAAIGLPIGQAIGRLGNYFNQELYGLPTNLPWGIYISLENRLPGYEGFEKFHPLFAYEGLWCLIIFIVFLGLLRSTDPVERDWSPRKPGQFFFLYLFLYAFGRFWLEFLRIESWMVPLPLTTTFVRVAQIISLGLMIISGSFLVKLHIFYIHIKFVLQKLKE